jgi:hypothetical protein
MDTSTPPIFFTEEQKSQGLSTAIGFTVSITLFIILYFIISIFKPNFFNLIDETEEEKAQVYWIDAETAQANQSFRTLCAKFPQTGVQVHYSRIRSSSFITWEMDFVGIHTVVDHSYFYHRSVIAEYHAWNS